MGSRCLTKNVRSELHIEALRRHMINWCIHNATWVVSGVFLAESMCRYLPVIIERVKLSFLADELFGGGLDGDEVCQVELEEEDTVLPGLSLELVDRPL